MFKKFKNNKNLIVPVLQKIIGKDNPENIDITASILGLAVVLMNADMEFHEKEKESFINLIIKECNVSSGMANEIADEILEIPEVDLEISYMGTLIAESADEERRDEILSSLFEIARADSVYDPYEDKYLKIISRHFNMDHSEFIAAKLKGKE